ncbi:MAG TPA: sigma-70 family RNA polymerase sigma factor [Bacteroidales bacterium]|nr:sigma-70 family RNA polymerase sigma factor [Bacteroidales bacterium]
MNAKSDTMKGNALNDDLQYWHSFKKGDELSFEFLFNKFYSVLINYGHKFSSERYIIEESVQDLFVKLWNNRLTLGDPEIVKPYLFKAFRTIIFRKLRKNSVYLQERLNDERYDFRIELAPDQLIINNEKTEEVRRKIQKGLSALTSRQLEAIYLRFYEDMAYEQISEILQMNIGGTYKLIYRAIERLREKIGSVLLFIFIASSAAETLPIS